MLNRNPLLALSVVASLALAGCGAARPLTAVGPNAKQGASLDALKKKNPKPAAEPAAPDADKNWVFLKGKVTKLLPDDNNGSKHQHFLFVANGETIKVAHNTDLAPYVPVKVGGEVEVKCEFIQSKPYDVAHWTHYDPRGGEGGYIKYGGKVYDRL